MKTKLALLTATLLVGFGSAATMAGPSLNSFPVIRPQATSTPAKPAFKSCCETRSTVMPNISGKGVTVTKKVSCTTGCNMAKAGKNCTASERRQCAV